jgi:ribulose-5-phosphate 4-epimerase/fuculose-1-phosphate aldolase
VQSALMFRDDIAYDRNYNGLAFDQSEGERMAKVLGGKSVLMLCNHGALVVGKTLPQAFERLYFLERAAQAQVLALSTGRPLKLISESVIKHAQEQLKRGSAVGGSDRGQLHFDALKRMLDRAGMDYAS